MTSTSSEHITKVVQPTSADRRTFGTYPGS